MMVSVQILMSIYPQYFKRILGGHNVEAHIFKLAYISAHIFNALLYLPPIRYDSPNNDSRVGMNGTRRYDVIFYLFGHRPFVHG